MLNNLIEVLKLKDYSHLARISSVMKVEVKCLQGNIMKNYLMGVGHSLAQKRLKI
jgi:hypothetical protein